MLPFNLSFPAEAMVFVVDEYSQYKKTMIDDYCYTHLPIVISEICQLTGKHTPPDNKNLLLDCVLKWDDSREYNHVADVLRYHSTGLLMTMNKPAAFDPLIRAKVDYLVLFRGRNLRHLRRIYRQYLSGILDDPAEFTSLFKSLSWGEGLVLDLSAMHFSGRFAGNYYKYCAHANDTAATTDTTRNNTYANLDVALDDWIANGINTTHQQDTVGTGLLSQSLGTDDPLILHRAKLGLEFSVNGTDITKQEPENEQIVQDWELITATDYTFSHPAQPSSTHELQSTSEPTQETSASSISLEPITLTPEPNTTIQEPQAQDKNENITEPQNQQQPQQTWGSYLYSKAWSLFG
jgi:hypothetical protein